MLDIVFGAMFIVVPCIALGVVLIKKKKYDLHRQLMTTLTVVLVAVVIAFEIDVRFYHPWVDLAEGSPYLSDPWHKSTLAYMLYFHLIFAISTFVIWVGVAIVALRKFDRPTVPNAYSRIHKRWAWVAAIDMTITAVTGSIFYWMAFVAT